MKMYKLLIVMTDVENFNSNLNIIPQPFFLDPWCIACPDFADFTNNNLPVFHMTSPGTHIRH